jgi:hypothetical protein
VQCHPPSIAECQKAAEEREQNEREMHNDQRVGKKTIAHGPNDRRRKQPSRAIRYSVPEWIAH